MDKLSYRKGIVLQFGMVSCIVNVETAINKPEGLVSVCDGGGKHPPTKISQVRRCGTCNDDVAYSDVKKARLVGSEFQVVTQEEVAAVKAADVGTTGKLLSLTPHPTQDVTGSTLQGEGFYFLVPDSAAMASPYAMLLDAVTNHPEVAFMGRWTPSSKTNTYRLASYRGEVLALEQRVSPENVALIPAEAGFVNQVDANVRSQLAAQFAAILPSMVTDFNPDTYADSYSHKLEVLLSSKAAVEGVVPERQASGPRATPAVGGVDLMATLAAMAEASGATTPAKKAAAPRRRKTA